MCFELVSVSPKQGGAALNGGMFSYFFGKEKGNQDVNQKERLRGFVSLKETVMLV
jgi:hypothetical protein